ncbi:exosome complex RNA-binding protein Csl4 [Candidatus Bathyarchaeota archaeon]|jgi:exosome complex component CSL4|nr:exosome complex RNA-binding protein Csl4 [Candidatus Bathyarchaeota archaeon]
MPARDFRTPAFVVPGEELCVAEEFMPGPGTYESGGTIYSDLTGDRVVDLNSRTVRVIAKAKTPTMPTDGSTVIGQVTNAHDKSAIVSIFKVDSEILGRPFTGILHISSASPRYERNMEDVCKTGDMIKAKVFNDKNRIPELTTAGRGLGVIRAYCSRCGNLLVLVNRRLQCRECGNTEHRRLVDDYGVEAR